MLTYKLPLFDLWGEQFNSLLDVHWLWQMPYPEAQHFCSRKKCEEKQQGKEYVEEKENQRVPTIKDAKYKLAEAVQHRREEDSSFIVKSRIL